MSNRLKTPAPRLICVGGAKASTMAVFGTVIPEADPELSFE